MFMGLENHKDTKSTKIGLLQILFVMGSLYQRSSGPYWSLRDTANCFRESGHEVTIVGSKDNRQQAEPAGWEFSRTFAFNKVGPYSLHLTPGLKGWLNKEGAIFDLASFQSVWQYNNYIVSQ